MFGARMLFALCLVVHETESLAVGSSVNPIRKIVNMLADMQKELEHEQDNEKELFEKAMCSCETGEKDLQTVIDSSTATIADLTSKLEEETAEKSRTDEELQNAYAGKAAAEADLAKATHLREKENAQFSKDAKTNKMQIGQLNGAIPQLEGGASGASLMQEEDSPKLRRVIEVTRYLTPEKRGRVLDFLDAGSDDSESSGQPSPGVAEIVGILKSMKDQMLKDLDSMTTDEKSAAAGFSDLKAAKQMEIKANTAAIIAKEKCSGELALAISQDKGALDDAKDELSDAQTYLASLTKACDTKKKGKRHAK